MLLSTKPESFEFKEIPQLQVIFGCIIDKRNPTVNTTEQTEQIFPNIFLEIKYLPPGVTIQGFNTNARINNTLLVNC